MSLSSDTLKLLGCMITPEELEAAITQNATTRVSNEEWESYYQQSLQAQKTAKERFREHKANSAMPSQAHEIQGLIAELKNEVSSEIARSEPESHTELFNQSAYSAKSATVLFGRKRSSFSM